MNVTTEKLENILKYCRNAFTLKGGGDGGDGGEVFLFSKFFSTPCAVFVRFSFYLPLCLVIELFKSIIRCFCG